MLELVQYNLPSQTLISNTDQCEHQVLRANTFAPQIGSDYSTLLVNVAIK